jgi:large subunit ribosomal protein L1
MPKHGKKFKAAIEKVDADKAYTIEEAVALAQEVKFAKFDESVNLDVRLGVDPRHADQQVRGTVSLPHGTGKTTRVAVFAQGDDAEAAKEAGADLVGAEDLVETIKGGAIDFEVAIATPDMMRVLGQVARVLGPRGLMPNPKAGTVTKNVKEAVEAAKAGRVEFRVDKTAIIHGAVGKASFSTENLVENVKAYLDAIVKARPSAAKGRYVKSVFLSTTMGPGIRLDVTVG